MKSYAVVTGAPSTSCFPRADGYAVNAYVKENMPELPVIVMTSLNAEELSGLDRSVVQNVLFKPLPMEEMADRVSSVCHG